MQNVPKVTLGSTAPTDPTAPETKDIDEVDFDFSVNGYATQPLGGLLKHAAADLSSDEEEDDDEESKRDWIQQTFKRSTKMDEISAQIQHIA